MSHQNRDGQWSLDTSGIKLANHSYNQDIGSRFLEQAEGEHASVASFARHALQLMTIGAPAELIIASQKASVDEIKHAKMCYGLAANFLGSIFEPGTLDVDGSLEAHELKEIIESVIKEGCVGETLSAIQIKKGSRFAQEPVVKNMLEEIALDESKHAQLAWNTIRWAIERNPKLQDYVQDVFSPHLEGIVATSELNEPLSSTLSCEGGAKDNVLRSYGLLTDEDKLVTDNSGIREIIRPNLKQQFKNVDQISESILKMGKNIN